MTKKLAASILALLLPVALGAAGLFSALSAKYEISFRSDASSADFFPESWLDAEIDARAEPIMASELARFPAILARALGKYPAAFITKTLRAIHLAGGYAFYGEPCSATSSSDVVYMSSEGIPEGYTDAYLEAEFHHEFAHLLIREYSFPAGDWDAANPPGFAYGEGGFSAIGEGEDDQEGSPADFKRGFLSPYSRSSRAEDVAMFAEWCMMKPGELGKLIAAHPGLRKKAGIYLAFLKRIAPGFSAPLTIK